ncbi:MAG: ammonium transporter [Clostridiales bacterium]|nr:ammonium transporter [Clostridiales bacterium]
MDLILAVNTVWIITAAALVFIMHAGFACVEAGFTQSKNTANIIMKNFMTIAIGTLCYYIIGFSLMFGEDVFGIGILGWSGFGIQNSKVVEGLIGNNQEGYILPLNVFWFFQAVFAATCATIVSGAVAERTKFNVYLFFCLFMCSFIYPITGHWIWGGGWLSNLGFHDFAGSTAVHAVGGFAALAAAKTIGARAGKYTNRKKVNVIPAHSIPLGALGVLLLWFGWFGFNCGSTLAADPYAIGTVAVNTILAGAAAALTTMLFTYIRSKKADVGMTLNGCLAGLVGITAGCDAVSSGGAIVIGIVCAVLMVIVIETIDGKLFIDDPVGAISVHGFCGMIGTVLVGVFARDGGLLYGGGWSMVGIQALGVAACGGFALVASALYFKILKHTVKVRVHRREEVEGLDTVEHGISAYNGMLGL